MEEFASVEDGWRTEALRVTSMLQRAYLHAFRLVITVAFDVVRILPSNIGERAGSLADAIPRLITQALKQAISELRKRAPLLLDKRIEIYIPPDCEPAAFRRAFGEGWAPYPLADILQPLTPAADQPPQADSAPAALALPQESTGLLEFNTRGTASPDGSTPVPPVGGLDIATGHPPVSALRTGEAARPRSVARFS